MLRFSAFILASVLMSQASTAYAAGKLPYGSRAGMEVDVVSMSGLDTSRAIIRTRHTRENAIEFCREYVGSVTEECIKEELATLLNDAVEADCAKGTFTNFGGERWKFGGKNLRTGQSEPDYRLLNLKTGEMADGSSASGYHIYLAIFQALCPRTLSIISLKSDEASARAQRALARAAELAKSSQFAEAFRIWEPLAKDGNAEAQFNLGIMYYFGEGIRRPDYSKALYWRQKAAAQDHAGAQLDLGVMYSNGQGVAQNTKVAASWYAKAARQGNARAQFNLGKALDDGAGVVQDKNEALKWYVRAAEQGEEDAQFGAARLYGDQVSTRYDAVKARNWYGIAALNGNAEAQLALGLMYSKGLGVPVDLPKAAMWFKLASGYISQGVSKDTGSVRAEAAPMLKQTEGLMNPEQMALSKSILSKCRGENSIELALDACGLR